ncbi:hypothetical protein C6988_05635 [Nitrosopumilus sp. b1]|uniref:hypothetical protein n=1 Tax=Nitrosopumilus sp. b1 TaxID=2109907 RepID=UPI0015F53646|nr:hypothetical protein [Nitrosopumilus sp. b1]KAF6242674.1 hypothetical protein C6988_05635 [Nitrosopumilus sp. b1]
MSQILERPKNSRLLIQDFLPFQKPLVKSSATSISCYICGKGLEDGLSLTAKHTPMGSLFFCGSHYYLK